MEQAGAFRHELKYALSPGDELALRRRMRAVIPHDAHAGPDGRYRIRSIYFDNIYDKALREKIDGVQKREKFRIRYYNDDLSYIVLEKKIKYNALCQKLEAPLTQEECRSILDGPAEWMLYHPSELVQELYCKLRCQQLRPRVLASYVREPFVCAAGNVRVTFDSEIRTTLFHRAFLEPEVWDISACDSPQDALLEVKYDAYLPDAITCALQLGTLRQQAFSKYGACRRFG